MRKEIAEKICVKLPSGEYLRDGKQKLMKFYTPKSAKHYLKGKGYINMNGIDFVNESEVKENA